jgi:hypothetical protein
MTAVTSLLFKPATSSMALLVLVLAGPAAAQQPSQAQISAIRSACRADYQAHCSSVQPGGPAALACLKKNVAALSPACQKAVDAVGGAAAPARTSGEAPSASPPATAAAPADEPAAAAAPARPAARSTTAVSPPPPVVPLRVELAILRRACGQDYRVNCPGVRPGGGQVIACLVANEAALSPGCRRTLASARQSL